MNTSLKCKGWTHAVPHPCSDMARAELSGAGADAGCRLRASHLAAIPPGAAHRLCASLPAWQPWEAQLHAPTALAAAVRAWGMSLLVQGSREEDSRAGSPRPTADSPHPPRPHTNLGGMCTQYAPSLGI